MKHFAPKTKIAYVDSFLTSSRWEHYAVQDGVRWLHASKAEAIHAVRRLNSKVWTPATKKD